jgi:Eukaryotic cytochrome b561
MLTLKQSRKVNSGHQIIGILVFVALIAQWVLGFSHHRTMERTQQPLRWAIAPHKFALGHIILGMGLVNISLGFRFALAGSWNRVYVPIAIVMLVFLALSVFLKRWFQTKWPGNRPQGGGGRGPVAVTYGEPQPGPYGAYAGQGASAGGPAPPYGGYEARSDIALETMDRPPAYGAGPTKPREFT